MLLLRRLTVRQGARATRDALLRAPPPRGAKSLFAGHASGKGGPPRHTRGVAATAAGHEGDAAAAVVRALGQVSTVLGPPVPHATDGAPAEATGTGVAQTATAAPRLRPDVNIRQTTTQLTAT